MDFCWQVMSLFLFTIYWEWYSACQVVKILMVFTLFTSSSCIFVHLSNSYLSVDCLHFASITRVSKEIKQFSWPQRYSLSGKNCMWSNNCNLKMNNVTFRKWSLLRRDSAVLSLGPVLYYNMYCPVTLVKLPSFLISYDTDDKFPSEYLKLDEIM